MTEEQRAVVLGRCTGSLKMDELAQGHEVVLSRVRGSSETRDGRPL